MKAILVCIFLPTGNHSLRRVAWSCREGIIFHRQWLSHSLWGCQQHILGGHCNNTLVLYHRAPPFVRIPFFGGTYSPRILSGFSFLGLEIHFFCGPGRCLQFQCAVSRLLLSSNLWLNSFFHRRRCDGVLCGLFGIAVQGTDPRMPFDLVRTLWLDVTRYF